MLVQKGQYGLARITDTTYYNVDPSSGEKTVDTTKGENGHSHKVTTITEAQDEIIEIAPQTATSIPHRRGRGSSGCTNQ